MNFFVILGVTTKAFTVRESIWDYILYNKKRFADHLPQHIDEYIQKMLEDGEWGGEPEIVAFS